MLNFGPAVKGPIAQPPRADYSIEDHPKLSRTTKHSLRAVLENFAPAIGPPSIPNVIIGTSTIEATYDPTRDAIILPDNILPNFIVGGLVYELVFRAQYSYIVSGPPLELRSDHADGWVLNHPRSFAPYYPYVLPECPRTDAITAIVELRAATRMTPSRFIGQGQDESISMLLQLLKVDADYAHAQYRSYNLEPWEVLGKNAPLPYGHLWISAPKVARLQWLVANYDPKTYLRPKWLEDTKAELSRMYDGLPNNTPMFTWLAQISWTSKRIFPKCSFQSVESDCRPLPDLKPRS